MAMRRISTAVMTAGMILAALFTGAVLISPATAQTPSRKTQTDIPYVEGGHARQKLDLYLPESKDTTALSAPLPLILWVHGGGWQSGDKSQCPPLRQGFVERGYAVASIGYRLSGDGPFPAQIQDVKAAIRYLRAHAKEYNIDPDHFGIWGSSAGGHLVALAGTSGGTEEFDKNLSGATSSQVQAVCDFFGPTDLVEMAQTKGYERHAVADSPESKLLGGAVLENKDKAKTANPITYVDKADPPFLIVHGDADPVVPPGQCKLLFDALKEKRVSVRFHTLQGAGHGGPGFAAAEVNQMVVDFFDRTLKGKDAPLTSEFLLTQSVAATGGAAPRAQGQRPAPSWDQLLTRRDTDKDGKLSQTEFPGPAPVFKRLDRNGDGYLDRGEFEAAPRPRGE